jgi:hypothetical protein
MEKRYRALRIISTFYKIAGALVLALALLTAIGLCLAGVLGTTMIDGISRDYGMGGMGTTSAALIGVFSGLGLLIGGALSGLTLFATGEGISLLIAMEENTRATAMHLAAHQRAPAPVVTPGAPLAPPPPPAG